MSESITLHIKGPSELKLDIEIATDKTILELKEAIAAKSDVEKERQRLIYSGKVLKDEETLATYKLQAGHTVHMVKGAPKTADASGSSSSAASAFGAASASQQRLPTMAAGQGRDPLAALEGVQGHGMGGGTFNPFADMGLGNLADPNAMTGMMNTPQFQQQMASMLQNPEVLNQIIASNPQLSAMGPQIRQMMQSEQFRNFLTNPESMRQMAQMRGMMGGAGGPASFPPPGAFGAAPPAAGAGATAGTAPAAGANPFDMFGGGAAGGAPGGGLFGGMPMPTPEQMAQMQATMGGGGAGGGFGGFGGPPAPPADSRPAHERYADQLAQLQGMGFYDGQKNLEALQIAGGNVSAAVEYLFSHP